MLTSRGAAAPLASSAFVHIGAAIIISITTLTSARAMDVTDTSCVGGWRGYNCVTQSGPAGDPYVRLVPQPLDEDEKSRLEARDQRWLARCRPAIEHDRYGVARYRYFAPGCEFGAGED